MWGIDFNIKKRMWVCVRFMCVPHSSITIYGWSHATNIIIIMCSVYVVHLFTSPFVSYSCIQTIVAHCPPSEHTFSFFSCAWFTFYATYVHGYYIKSIIEGWKMHLWIINVIVVCLFSVRQIPSLDCLHKFLLLLHWQIHFECRGWQSTISAPAKWWYMHLRTFTDKSLLLHSSTEIYFERWILVNLEN